MPHSTPDGFERGVLTGAKQKAGVQKPGSVHALRHSFATHLPDKGTDVIMIMKLPGGITTSKPPCATCM
jgi:site-specific recombinase XerD